MRETYQPPTTSPTGPPHDHNLEETALLPPSTEIDTIRQSSTNHNENSCPRVRTRGRQRRSVSSLGMEIAPRPQRIGHIARNCRPLAVLPIDQSEPQEGYSLTRERSLIA